MEQLLEVAGASPRRTRPDARASWCTGIGSGSARPSPYAGSRWTWRQDSCASSGWRMGPLRPPRSAGPDCAPMTCSQASVPVGGL